jgi:hypothetical protein
MWHRLVIAATALNDIVSFRLTCYEQQKQESAEIVCLKDKSSKSTVSVGDQWYYLLIRIGAGF